MTAKYEDHDHEHENGEVADDTYGIESDDPEGHEAHEESSEEAPKKSSLDTKKIQKYVFIAMGVGVAGLAANHFYQASQKPVQQSFTKKAQNTGPSSPTGNAAAENPEAVLNGGTVQPTPPAQNVDPSAGQTPVNPVTPGAQPGQPELGANGAGVDPSLAAQGGLPGQPTGQVAPVAPLAPETQPNHVNQPVNQAGPAPVSAAVVAPISAPNTNLATTPAGSNKESIEWVLGEMSKKMDAMNETLKNFDGVKIENRLQTLEERIAALEGGRKAPKAVTKAVEKAPAVASNANGEAAPAEKKVTHVRRVARQQSKPAVEKADNSTLFTKASASSESVGVESTTVRTSREFVLQSVIPGRLWIKLPDGTSRTFGSGETLPDGSKVVKIEADKNRVQTSAGLLQ